MPSKSLLSQSCGISVIKSHLPPKSSFLWVSVPLPDPQVGKSVLGPRTFLTVQEFLWYNCSAVCGSSAWQLYGGVNGDLLEEGLCHRLGDPGLLHPEPLPLQPATADLYLCRRLKPGSVSVGSLGPGVTMFCLNPPSVSGRYWV